MCLFFSMLPMNSIKSGMKQHGTQEHRAIFVQKYVCPHAFPSTFLPYLGHEPVSPRVLLIFEDNICVVIRREFFKALGVARYFTLGSPAGSQGLLGYLRAELLVVKRDELLREPPLAVPPPRPAALRGRCEEEDQGTQRGGEEDEGDPHRPGRREVSPWGERCLQYLPGSVPDSIVRDSRNITSERLG